MNKAFRMLHLARSGQSQKGCHLCAVSVLQQRLHTFEYIGERRIDNAHTKAMVEV